MISKSRTDFDDILKEIGDFGSYQKKLVAFFLIPLGIVIPWITMNILFMVFTPNHWCSMTDNNFNDSHHQSIDSRNASNCYIKYLNDTEALMPDEVLKSTLNVPCKTWHYENVYFEETASSKWNMVCDRAYLASLVLTLSYAGSTIGTPIYGTLSDKIGRRPVFFLLVILSTITGVASVFVPDLTTFIVLRAINGSLMPSIYQLPYIIVLEFVGSTKRTNMNGIFNLGYTAGLCTLPLIAYFSRHWITFGLVTSLVSVPLLLYWKFLPESPRWLVSQERYNEAAVILSGIARENGKIYDEKQLLPKLMKIADIEHKERLEANNSPVDLVRYPSLRRKFLIITLCWIADIFAYYGLILNVSNLSGNFFLNFFLSSIIEGPGLICGWYCMEKYGRRWIVVIALLLTAISCFFLVIQVGEPSYAQVISLIGKFGASAAFFGVYQQSSELYPTTMRLIGMGVSGAIANAGNIILPFIIYLSVINQSIPFLIIGSINLMAAFAAIFLPETLNETLPLTIEDAEQFGKEQTFISCCRTKTFSVTERKSKKDNTS
ncbi:organic cation transporter 1-like [Parasteatoda tepidariorum]|uniref:organic cation transporter 1-like n=1 Tax=Parasteatoda tepidariorum TaxID=114398 RepID=UPI001C7244F7|nr:organic cation transporter 1-like [Parasteatoda tepidariorum]